jgi:hypothetical protein
MIFLILGVFKVNGTVIGPLLNVYRENLVTTRFQALLFLESFKALFHA